MDGIVVEGALQADQLELLGQSHALNALPLLPGQLAADRSLDPLLLQSRSARPVLAPAHAGDHPSTPGSASRSSLRVRKILIG